MAVIGAESRAPPTRTNACAAGRRPRPRAVGLGRGPHQEDIAEIVLGERGIAPRSRRHVRAGIDRGGFLPRDRCRAGCGWCRPASSALAGRTSAGISSIVALDRLDLEPGACGPRARTAHGQPSVDDRQAGQQRFTAERAAVMGREIEQRSVSGSAAETGSSCTVACSGTGNFSVCRFTWRPPTKRGLPAFDPLVTWPKSGYRASAGAFYTRAARETERYRNNLNVPDTRAACTGNGGFIGVRASAASEPSRHPARKTGWRRPPGRPSAN